MARKVVHHFTTFHQFRPKVNPIVVAWLVTMCGSLWWMIEYPPVQRVTIMKTQQSETDESQSPEMVEVHTLVWDTRH